MNLQKIKETFIKEYKKTTARDWFCLSVWAILVYCGVKLALYFFMDHVILQILLIERFTNEGKTALAKAIALNTTWFGYYTVGFVISLLIYMMIKKHSEVKT